MTNARTELPPTGNEQRRSEPRRRALKGARIVFNDGASSISCIVRDLSADGAKLVVESVIGIPDEFKLVLDDGTQTGICSLQWKSQKAMGVRFA